MSPDNLTFSSKIDPQVEDVCFDILLEHLRDVDEKIYVQNVVIMGQEILFFVKMDDGQNIIRVPMQMY